MDGDRLDAHLATGLDHLIKTEEKKETHAAQQDRILMMRYKLLPSDVACAQKLTVSSNPTLFHGSGVNTVAQQITICLNYLI